MTSLQDCLKSLISEFWCANQLGAVVRTPPAGAEVIGDQTSALGPGRSSGGGNGSTSSVLACKAPHGQRSLQSVGSQKVEHDFKLIYTLKPSRAAAYYYYEG